MKIIPMGKSVCILAREGRAEFSVQFSNNYQNIIVALANQLKSIKYCIQTHANTASFQLFFLFMEHKICITLNLLETSYK